MGIFARSTLKREQVELERNKIALQNKAIQAKSALLGRVLNSGYDEGGASRAKKSLKGWLANSRSPQEDIENNLDVLRQRSRSLWMSSPLAVSAIRTKKTNVVGSGLRLKSRINYRVLGMTREQADEWERKTEREFELFASSRWCDALRINNLYELQSLAYMSWLMNGDGFAVLKHDKPTLWMPYGLRIYLIEADRVSTPLAGGKSVPWNITAGKNNENGNFIYSGVEVDSNGAVVAYWICNQYPNGFSKGAKREWKRIEAYGSRTGNPNILHLLEQERCEQYRGVPFLAPVIECLKQITRYTEAELMAAVVQSFFTVFIKTEAPTTDNPLGIGLGEDEQLSQDDDVSYELGSGTMNILRPGEDAIFADPKRPSSGFDPFVSAMAKMIGAALEIPYELLMKSFTASYSASRAALLEAWKAIKTSRSWFANDFCQPIYELWLTEAVARGRIDAPGFFNDPAIKAAWCKSEWIGPAQGQIDPVKEAQASEIRVKNAFSTHEQETTALTGGNWDDNIEQLKMENERLREAGPMNPNEGSVSLGQTK